MCGTILVGVFHECTEKFKLAAAVSILHVALAFPVLCGTFAAYRYGPRLIFFFWGAEAGAKAVCHGLKPRRRLPIQITL